MQEPNFSLDSLLNLSEEDLKKFLKSIDLKALSHALYNKEEKFREHIFAAMTKAALKEYKQIEANLKKPKTADITKFIDKIENEIKRLVSSVIK